MKVVQLVLGSILSFAAFKAQEICSIETNPLVSKETENFVDLYTGGGFKMTFNVVGDVSPEFDENLVTIDFGKFAYFFNLCADVGTCSTRSLTISFAPDFSRAEKRLALNDVALRSEGNLTIEIIHLGAVQSLEVFIDGELQIGINEEAPGDLSSLTVEASSQFSVENMEITTALVDVAKSILFQTTTVAVADGSLIEAFLLFTLDGCGLGFRKGGLSEGIEATFVDEEAGLNLAGEIVDNGDGTYSIGINAVSAGTFTINVNFCVEEDCFSKTIEDALEIVEPSPTSAPSSRPTSSPTVEDDENAAGSIKLASFMALVLAVVAAVIN